MDDDTICSRPCACASCRGVMAIHNVIVTLTCSCPVPNVPTAVPTAFVLCKACNFQRMEVASHIHSPYEHMKSSICMDCPACIRFKKGRHEDAHEYLMNLLDVMHESMVKAAQKGQLPGSSPSASAQPTSLIHRIFGGRIRNQVG